MRSVLLVLLCTLSAVSTPVKEKPPGTYRIPLPPKPDFSALEWLIGEWTGKTTGQGPPGEIHLQVSYDLEKRFMIFREEITLPATPTVPASNESWLGVLSGHASGKGFVLRTFSSTGFITRYRATVEEADIYFNPEGGEQLAPGWLFRRTLQRLDIGELSETVQMAPPNKPFFEYYTAKLTRKSSP